jgi:predicted nucleic acid-binding protein
MSEIDILTLAAQALAEREALRKATIAADRHILALCRQYEDATGVRGFAPHHLAQSCRARGIAA